MSSESKTSGKGSYGWCRSEKKVETPVHVTLQTEKSAKTESSGKRRLGGMSAVPRYNTVGKSPFADQLWAQEFMEGGVKPVRPQVESDIFSKFESQREMGTDAPKSQLGNFFGPNSGMSAYDEKQKLDNADDKARKEAFDKLSKSQQEEFGKLCCAAKKKENAMRETDVFKNAEKATIDAENAKLNAEMAILELNRSDVYKEAKKAKDDFRAYGLEMEKEHNLKVDLAHNFFSKPADTSAVEAYQAKLEREHEQKKKRTATRKCTAVSLELEKLRNRPIALQAQQSQNPTSHAV